MRFRTTGIFGVLVALSAHPAAACERPATIEIPDGAKASEEDMTRAGAAYHEYMLAMQRYQVCLEDEANTRRLAGQSLDRATNLRAENDYVAQHNAASDEMTSTTDDFTRAIEAYKSRAD